MVLTSRLKTPHQRPEFFRMVHVSRMAKLMRQDVSDQVAGQEKQFIVQTDGAPSGAACPSRPLSPDHGPGIFKACLQAETGQPGNKLFSRASRQPALQCPLTGAAIADRSLDRKLSKNSCPYRNGIGCCRQIGDQPLLPQRRQIDDCRQQVDWFGRSAFPEFGKALKMRGDPFLFFLQNSGDLLKAASPGHHDDQSVPCGDGEPDALRPGGDPYPVAERLRV